MTPRWLRRLAVAALAVAAATAAQAQPMADPRQPWQTADSAHFRVHYRASQRTQAEAVARAAERIWPQVTQALAWEPRRRTEVVVYSEFDLANGFTTPLPYSLMGVFLAPPDDGQLLDNSAWLDLLLVHEFTHAVHLDKVRGAPRVLQAIFGSVPWFIPNLFQPGWGLEGLAVVNESDPAAGRGRLRGPMFEAWLRAERAAGFLSLREINSDGRALPLSKQYLYGAYFFEFLARRHGVAAPQALVERYSGNIVPRLHTSPVEATGRTMDVLWDEFLADLAQQVDTRAAPLLAQPEALGPRLVGPVLDVPAVAALPGGDLLAVVEDGLHGALLQRVAADGSRRTVTRVLRGARVSAAPDGRVLVAQPDICNTLYLAYDLYRLDGDRLQQLSHCAHLRRAVYAGTGIAALQLVDGRTQLVTLGAAGGEPVVVHAPADGTELIDLAATPDGSRVALITRRGGDWRIVEADLAQPGAAPRLLLRRDAPMHSLQRGAQGLEFVATVGGVNNVWRLAGGQLQRLTHTHTAVVAHAGSAPDGSLATVVVAPQGHALHRLPAPAVLQTLAADTAVQPAAPAVAETTPPLGDGRRYSALPTLVPRWWLPVLTSDRGLTAFGASTSGSDALGWHQYIATLQWETSQKELLGGVEYLFLGNHGLALGRTLTARAWTGEAGDETTTVYDRRTQAQWLSLLPLTRLERRIRLGVGAALDRLERVDLPADSSVRQRDERIAALLAEIDTRGSDWFSEGPNRGLHASLLFESYKPFRQRAGGADGYDGSVLRADLRGFVPLSGLGRSVLALRWTEVSASGRTAPFQLGGASDDMLQIGTVLNDRELALRGYRGDEPELRGRNARIASVEWRLPLADIDRHAMVPPVGINRLSTAVFFDVGGAWDNGDRPLRWRRGVGVEVLGELKLLYALGLHLRAGVARGLDAPQGTRAYLAAGRAF